MEEGSIVIKGARVNNLKDISLEIPRGKLVVITGVSGSGKSSLAFDTLYAEGQRRFAESLSSYARQFLGRMSKPDVDTIEGIPPAIAIEQKVNTRNPRSTVGTTTEIYDYLRLIYARIGRTYSPVSGKEVRCNTVSDVMRAILEGGLSSVYILSDVGWSSRDDLVELMLSLSGEGFSRLYDPAADAPVRLDEVMKLSESGLPKEMYLFVDRVKLDTVDEDLIARLRDSVSSAFSRGDVILRKETPDGKVSLEKFSQRLEMDGIEFRRPDEFLFSFNSPLGACPVCGGLGKIIGISEDLVVPDKTKSIYDGAIACWRGDKMGWFRDHLIEVSERYGIRIFEPWCRLSEKEKDIIWNGHSVKGDDSSIVGINEFFEWVESNRYKIQYKYMLSRYSGRTVCSSCGGSRLRKEAHYVKVGGRTIAELLSMNVVELIKFLEGVELSDYERGVAGKAIDEVLSRLRYIDDVGLGYLTLSRNSNTLSGGESQRINLVTALGSSLVGSMYILDEPSIGLHPRDTDRLISVLKRLRDIGNTVVVVEHDEKIIRAADLLIDMGPMAGTGGGEVVYTGTIEGSGKSNSLTLRYLRGEMPGFSRKKRTSDYYISVEGAMEHNLKDITVKFPLGVFTVVTGASGSGKSTLVGDILYPAMKRRINETGDLPGTFRGLGGNLDRITRVEYVDQNPLGKSSRSNAVTYLKVYDDIRKLLSSTQAAKLSGLTPSSFSFNQEGGRCPECQGEGFVRIGMQFMADVTMVCSSCGGKRFKSEVLEVRYEGKNVDDILSMSVAEAIEFFGSLKDPQAKLVAERLKPLADVGLSYIKLGQPSSTLSGGESQRVKLAYFLSMSLSDDRPRKDRILFIFDEPTTGLHFYDVEKLLKAFDMLLSRGHTIVVVEHNTEGIRAADWVIDLGPEAGDGGGKVVFAGTPEDLVSRSKGHTARYLASSTL